MERQFVTKSRIIESMHAARTGYRERVDRRLSELEEENRRLRVENEELRRMIYSMNSLTSGTS